MLQTKNEIVNKLKIFLKCEKKKKKIVSARQIICENNNPSI